MVTGLASKFIGKQVFKAREPQMISEYDQSDNLPVSFVSPQNEKVYSVQFVIKTESIEKEEKETKKEEPVKEKGFWELFLELF